MIGPVITDLILCNISTYYYPYCTPIKQVLSTTNTHKSCRNVYHQLPYLHSRSACHIIGFSHKNLISGPRLTLRTMSIIHFLHYWILISLILPPRVRKLCLRSKDAKDVGLNRSCLIAPCVSSHVGRSLWMYIIIGFLLNGIMLKGP